MKWTSYITSLFFIVLVASCDYIEDPIQGGGGTNPDTGAVRRVLIEDFTGHKCPNCPLAQQELVNLHDNFFGDQLIAISVHAGFFASTSPGFTYDFTTPEGEELNTFFGVQAYPSGMVNRTGYPTGEHLSVYDSWATKVSAILANPPDMDIAIEPNYSSTNHSLSVDIDVEVLNGMNDVFHLVVYLTEDSIIQPQIGPGNDHIEDYVHNHVLRGSMNTAWGETIATGEVIPTDTYSKSYAMSLDSEWNEQNMHIIAFVYRSSDLEIIQVEEAKLK
jgi:thiol-disulfide isomerase/thioredoxin